VRFSVFFFDFGQTAVFVGIFEGGLQEVAVFGEGLGEIGLRHDGAIN
jgi:transcriptional coactivator/pterin dehydratase